LTRSLLIVRPEPGASATAERAASLGMKPIIMPFFAAHALAWTPPPANDFDAVMLTSANAARLGGPALARYHALPLFAVGDATAIAAGHAGFVHIITGMADANALVSRAASDGFYRLLHLCGHTHVTLHPLGCAITAIPVYEAAATDTIALPAGPFIALVHSPRAAARLAELAGDRSAIDLVAISRAARTAAGDGWHSVSTAAVPTDAAMLAIAARLCDSGGEGR
jgi:uroporphyrinogen-III synthase